MSTAGSCRKCAHGNEGEKEGRNGRRRSKSNLRECRSEEGRKRRDKRRM
jgi:hypothetical protein